MNERPCKFCGTKTTTRVWTKGTKRLWVPICLNVRCWTKYRKILGR